MLTLWKQLLEQLNEVYRVKTDMRKVGYEHTREVLTLVNFQAKKYRGSMQLKYQYSVTKIISKNQKSQIIIQVTLKFSDIVWSSIEIIKMLCNWLQSNQQGNGARYIYTKKEYADWKKDICLNKYFEWSRCYISIIHDDSSIVWVGT